MTATVLSSAGLQRGRLHRRADRWINLVLLAPGCGFLLLAMALPVIQLVLASFGLFGLGAAGQFTLQNYAEISGNVLFTSAFRFSLQIAAVTTIVSVVFATGVTALLQIDFPGRRLVNALYKVPLVIPSLIAAFLVLTMIGPGGMAARILQPIGIRWPSLLDAALFGLSGVTWAIGQYLWTQALLAAPATAVSPFYYLLLVWAMVIGYLVWGDVPTVGLMIGSVIVVGSALFLLWREARLPRLATASR